MSTHAPGTQPAPALPQDTSRPATARRRPRVAAALALTASLVLSLSGVASPASAAPFAPDYPTMYIAQGNPSQFSVAEQVNGQVEFQHVGAVASVFYNAMGYREADNYIYAMEGVGTPTARNLLRVHTDGTFERLGVPTGITVTANSFTSGTFMGDTLYVLATAAAENKTLYALDVDAVSSTPITLSQSVTAPDLVESNGYLWGIENAGNVSRIDVATGQVTSYPRPAGIPSGSYGSAWVYGNGNLAFSNNASGTIYQVSVAGPTGPLALVSSVPGPPNSNNDGTSSPASPVELSLAKTVVTSKGTTTTAPGETVTYTLTVTNNSESNSSGFVVTDEVPTALTNIASTDCTVSGQSVQCVGGKLPKGTSTQFTFTATVPTGAAGGTITNTALVNGNELDPAGANNTASANLTVETPTPSIDVTLEAASESATTPGAPASKAGDTITYTYTVTNTGGVPLTGTGPELSGFTGTGTSPSVQPGPVTLQPGASQTFTSTYTLTQADIDAGGVSTKAEATGTPPTGGAVSATSGDTAVHTAITAAPGLQVTQTSSVTSPDDFVAGQTVTYTYTMTNSGNVTLSGVTPNITDFTGTGSLSNPSPAPAVLAPGESQVFTVTYTFTEEDIKAGSVTSKVSGTASTPKNATVTSETLDSIVPQAAAPKLATTATTTTQAVTHVGQVITYEVEITNEGNITLFDVHPDLSESTAAGKFNAPEGVTLAPGEKKKFLVTYEVVQEDLDFGSVKFDANGKGTPREGISTVVPDSKATSLKLDAETTTTMSLQISTDGAAIDKAGQIITYTFVLENTGSTTILGAVPTCASFSGMDGCSNFDFEPTTLAPGDKKTITVEYTVTQEDVNSGHVNGVFDSTGASPAGTIPPQTPKISLTTIDQKPDMELAISVDPIDAEHYRVGQELTYTYVVRNSGNVTLLNVYPQTQDFSGTGTLGPITGDSGPLLPGEEAVFTTKYTLTQEDVDAGTLTHSFDALAQSITGTTIKRDPATITTPTPPILGLAVESSADRPKITAAGQKVTYTFVVTNTGNVTIPNVSPIDLQSTGTGTFGPVVGPVGPLGPNQSATFTVEYITTQADVDAGEVTTSGTATGTPPSGWTLPPAQRAEVTVQAVQTPDLTVHVSSKTEKFTKAGEKITYTISVENTGNVTMQDVYPNIGKFTGSGSLSGFAGGPLTLAPGEHGTWTVTYIVTEADVKRGVIVTGVDIEATLPDGSTFTSERENLTLTIKIPAGPDSKTDKTTPGQRKDLENTGSGDLAALGALGVLTLAAGVTILLRRRNQVTQ